MLSELDSSRLHSCQHIKVELAVFILFYVASSFGLPNFLPLRICTRRKTAIIRRTDEI
jgi:hypothetical protein